ncbi:hypothetical protein [Dictyobacter arantiisoli]|uniref:LppX_LprAFG lipoprotein n=1 Tax=Dictyobacter arantiisoli TaxID=2014874 RepID=A0A5A5T611_9CHLR|nr:hypothetical protein [Dictyobacter arantiisoli]GCF06675.1 hypothetical protein KDI_02390 [Dictyobacter arantiisoli]
MKVLKKSSFMFLFIALFALMLSACSQVNVGSTSGKSASDLTPLQVLQKSADAMKSLKSAHLDLSSNSSVQAASTGQATTKSSPSPQALNTNVTITGSGDEVLPDQSQLNLNINAASQKSKHSEVVKGDNAYIQNAQGKWYVINKKQFNTGNNNVFSGATLDQKTLIGLIENVKLVDHQTETLNGVSLRHLTATLDKTALKQLLTSNPQLASSFGGQQNLDSVLNSAKQFLAVVDVWVDENKFYVQRTKLNLNLVIDSSFLQITTIPKVQAFIAKTSLSTTIDLSKFDQPVTITTPANATPITDTKGLMGLGQ